ncbi:MAG: hypothetical protein F9K24_14740 [Leptonema illini]|uniref:Uncharacterized protein n=1 Tax=Leptonema illini TaxID=183 RepID=A0A833GZY3_9LEPT|nr:MAG: hypothetical protein F9K24_14740 [Leptonema illini]
MAASKQGSRLILTVFLLIADCFSPRESCEYNYQKTPMETSCWLMLSLSSTCPERVAAGKLTLEDCAESETLALLACGQFAAISEKCSKEPDFPKIPLYKP